MKTIKRKLIAILLCLLLILVIAVGDAVIKDQTPEKPEETVKPPETGTKTLSNVFIIEGKGKKVQVFVDGKTEEYPLAGALSEEVEQQIGDLLMENNQIVKMNRKPDQISGSILTADESYVELEEYGKVSYTKDVKIYHMGEVMSMGTISDISAGQEGVQFVIAGNQICAVLIESGRRYTKEEENKRIRVLIKTDHFREVLHNSVTLTVDSAYTLTDGKTKVNFAKGEKLKINDDFLKSGKGVITPESKDAKIKLLSVKRGGGSPSYRGVMEIEKRDGGFTIINDLSLEEYLYAVLPSEMPGDAGYEALKVQAVCARSYAVNQMTDQKYASYGANVDDSVSYQVYNNYPETADTIKAVRETEGEVAVYKDQVINAYYFSTSCGMTSAVEDVWLGGGKVAYLTANMQNIEPLAKKEKSKHDFSVEANFRTFLKEKKKTYDSEFPYYRWEVSLTPEDIEESIEKNLYERYNANPKLLQTLNKKKNGEYQSKSIRTIGKVKDIKVSKRAESGLVTEVILVGSKETIKVSSEYNIRKILASGNNKILLQDGSNTSALSMLPSAYFVIDKKQSAKAVTSFHLRGGGFGHGVGMSQNGVMKMEELGTSYQEIIKHYFPGAEITSVIETGTEKQ